MHSTDLGNSNVPAFLIKLWKIVEDPNTNGLIGWSASGNSFIIHNQAQFSKELLPLYFKHSNMASFIRQLNMYGFKKLSNVEQGSLRFDQDEMEFYHQYFIKGKYSHLANIKRKMPTSKVRPEVLREVISDVNTIRAEQENVDSLLKAMKEENTSLWREVAILRQKHLKQQQIVEKLIQFLASIVKPNCKIGLKRKLPLMIGNGSSSCVATESKIPRLSQQLPMDNRRLKSNYAESTHFPKTLNSPNGPVIHDVTDSLEDDPFTDVAVSSVTSPKESTLENKDIPSNILPANSPLSSADLEPLIILHESPLSFQEVLSPQSECVLPDTESLEDKSLNTPAALLDPLTSSSLFPNTSFSKPDENHKTTSEETAENEESESNNNQMQLAISTTNDSLTKNTITDHLDTIESDLDWLQEQLSSGGLNIDSSTLLGVCSLWNNWGTDEDKLFSTDDSLAGSIFPYETEKEDGNSVTGTELIQYTPSLDASLLDSTIFPSKPLNDDLSSLPGTEITDLPALSVDPLLCD